MSTREGMKVQTQTHCYCCQGPTLFEVNSCKAGQETSWTRKIYADDPSNALELHHRVYPDERVIWVETMEDNRHSKCLNIITARVPGLDEIFSFGACQECDGEKA